MLLLIIIHLVQFTQLNYIMFSTDWFIHNNMQPDAISLQLLCMYMHFNHHAHLTTTSVYTYVNYVYNM